jgi:hypothetical protein
VSAVDLTPDEVEALRWLRRDAQSMLNAIESLECKCFSCERHLLVLAVLDKLIGGAR